MIAEAGIWKIVLYHPHSIFPGTGRLGSRKGIGRGKKPEKSDSSRISERNSYF